MRAGNWPPPPAVSIWAGTILSPKPPRLWMSPSYSDQCKISSQTCFRSDFSNVRCEMFWSFPRPTVLPPFIPSTNIRHASRVEAFSVSICSLWFLIHRRNLHYSFCTFNCLELFPGSPELICIPFLLSCHLSSTFYWVCVQIVFWICFFFGFTTKPQSKLYQFHCSRTFLRAGKMATR